MSDPLERERAVFSAARRLPAGERAAYLEETCAGDAGLRKRAEGLLEAGEEAEGFLQEPAPGAQRPDGPPAAATLGPGAATRGEKAGDRIGRYKLLQQIGEGGCGLVYMAEQEEPVRRRVALKVIKLGMDTKQVIARFEAERQALAMMDHANIAKVLDAGTTETGRPYFVMELVRGIKITEYCDEHNFSTTERLDLFMQVCHAVQHAHQKGIIHRDLKPSNILVASDDGVPVPKVIDFGIAKATQGRLTDQTLFTAFEQFIGTPAYMSPEQAELTMQDVDTRTDIYSLGVLLYELLTGRTPFNAQELLASGLDAMRRTIREQEPERPSTRLSTMRADELTTTAKYRHTEAAKLVHLLRGDLDWIVMKCLEKDRTRRYETAGALVGDVEHHLHNQPVEAGPPDMLYRTGKFLRRRRKEVALAALVFTISCCVVGLGLQQRNSKRLREDAQLDGWRREELQTLDPVIAGLVQTGVEKEHAQGCINRLTERIRNGQGSRSDHELLARFLTRDVRLEGRTIQILAQPSVSVGALTGRGYAVRGVAAIINPIVMVSGKRAAVDAYPMYLTGGTGRDVSVGDSGIVQLTPMLQDLGKRSVSCTLEVQLVKAKGTAEIARDVKREAYLPIGDPVAFASSAGEFLFLHELPEDYPIEVKEEDVARRISEGFRISSPVVREERGSIVVELEVTPPEMTETFPIALEFELLRLGEVPLEGCRCGLDSSGVVWLPGGRLSYYGLFKDRLRRAQENYGVDTMQAATKLLLRFKLPALQPFAPGEQRSVRIRIRSSREVALDGSLHLERFLSVPAFERTISAGTASAHDPSAEREGALDKPNLSRPHRQ